MNLLGKMLTFLILVASIAFCFIAIVVVASHQNWKQEAIDNRNEAERWKRASQAAQQELEEARTLMEEAAVSRAKAISQLYSNLAVVQQRFDTANSELQDKSTKLNAAADSLKQAEARLAQQDQTISTLNTQNRDLVDNVAEKSASLASILSQVETAVVKQGQLESQLEDALAKFNELKKVADVLGFDENTLIAQTPPDLTGRVTSVSSRQRDVFAISLGTDDGLKEGHTVDVVRGGRHIGTAKVTMAKPNHATARFVDGMRNAPVQVDDKVTTTLSKRMNTAVSLVN